VWVPRLAAPIAGEVQRFAELVATLRAECPWDREQTHESLRRHLLEEAYEVLEAIDGVDPETGEGYEHLEEELGDLLFQVLFHATLAAEAGRFTLADVATTVHDKLRARHPHVFGDATAGSAEEAAADWEQAKKAEKGRDSVFDGIPEALPSLLYALKVQKKAASLAGGSLDVARGGEALDVGSGEMPSVPDLDDAVDRASASPTPEALGDLLLAVVDLARRAGVDPETTLRSAAVSWRDRALTAEARMV
jgi:tetrapyrrole methylase family protein/MazG family protein